MVWRRSLLPELYVLNSRAEGKASPAFMKTLGMWPCLWIRNSYSSSLVNSVCLLLLLSCVNCHISRLVDASQIRVSSSRSVKPLSPFGGLCIMQSSMTCCTDWFGAPHSHSEVDFRPHLFMTSPNLPSFNRYLRPYDAPGSQMPSCSCNHPMCVGIRHHCPCPPL